MRKFSDQCWDCEFLTIYINRFDCAIYGELNEETTKRNCEGFKINPDIPKELDPELKKLLREYWEAYRKEERIPKRRIPQFPNVRHCFQYTKYQKRVLRYNNAWEDYRIHIRDGRSRMPKSYDEFKEGIGFYLGWCWRNIYANEF